MRTLRNSGWIVAALLLIALVAQRGWTQAASSTRVRTLLSQALPHLDGNDAKATLVEINYAPGESSTQHSHPCPVMVYVAQGAIRSQVQGGAAAVYKAGDTFYEPPNGVHAVSANASTTEPARFVAFFVCDGNKPLTVPVPNAAAPKGK